MKRFIVAILCLTMNLAWADYANDMYADNPDALLRIVTAAQKTPDLESSKDPTKQERWSYYLKSVEYMGPLDSPFGTIHVARLLYIRSLAKGQRGSPRGHGRMVFLDANFKVRLIWNIDFPGPPIHVEGAKLVTDHGEVVLDYSPTSKVKVGKSDNKPVPMTGFDGGVYPVPIWDRVKENPSRSESD